jgi:hypothetical protein
MAESLTSGVVYHDDEWPHGLRCAECQYLFQEGERYSRHLHAFQDDVPILKIVCVGCALGFVEEGE